MSYVRIVAVCQNSRVGDCCWNQISRPIYSFIVDTSVVMRSRERIESPDLGRRFDRFAIIIALVLMPRITSLMSPCSLRMAVESMYEHDAFWSADHYRA